MSAQPAMLLTYKCGWRMPGEARKHPAWVRAHLRGGSAAALGVAWTPKNVSNDNIDLMGYGYASARAY